MCMHARMRRLVWVRTYVDVDHGRREAKYARAHSYIVMCIDLAITCNILYCWTDMYLN